jgi:nitrite reductase/ring-hydroxylating ferredoxin subunit
MMDSRTEEFVEVGTVDQLAEGQLRAVEVNGKRVVLAMVEGVPYALGAICTHERAHLDEGSLMGYELYCPLHFSCFDVRTGEALAPPADRATTVHAVKVQDGKVLVSGAPVDPESLEEVSTEAAVPAGDAEAEDTAEPSTEARDAEVVTTPEARRPPDAKGPPISISPPRPPAWPGRLLHRLEELSWLENGSEWLGAALRPVREDSRLGARVFDLLHGRLVGHALHPALSDFPIGLWSGASLLDAFGDHDAAGKLGAGGAVIAIGTAVTGYADWTVSDGRDRRLGLLHGVLQTAALGIVGGSLAARRRGAIGTGKTLQAAGLGLSLSSAYLGGHLVLGRAVMVDRTSTILGPRQWTRAIETAELDEGTVKAVEVAGRNVLVSHFDGAVSVIEDACTHAGGPLSHGKVENGIVKCPWHGSCFRLRDGAVVRGPASHPQPILDARVHDGWIEVRGRRRR